MSWTDRLLSSLTIALFAAGFLLPTSAQAQLQRVEQTVFGMDCAPCAHAMENRLGQMEGVTSVSVSLNEGTAKLDLAATNSITLEAIRKAVIQGGFSPEEATLQVSGTLRQEDGEWVLSSPSGEQYVLQDVEATVSEEELRQRSGQEVTLTGQVPKGEEPSEKGWALHASELDVSA